MHLPRVLVTLVLITPALAGCIAAGDDGELLSAWSAEAVARPVAEAWNPNATAASAWAEESLNRTFDTDTTFEDPDLGDGRAIAWTLVYTAPDVEEEAYLVTVLGNRTVHETRPVDLTTETNAGSVSVTVSENLWPARNWSVDSTLAASILAANASWSEIVEGEEEITDLDWGMIGAPEGEDPVWYAGVEAGEGNDSREVGLYVNASSGQILEEAPAWFSQRFDSDVSFGDGPTGVPTESGTFEGTLSVNDASTTHTFTVDHDAHPALTVDLVSDPPQQTAGLHATLTTPTDEQVHTNVTLTGGAGAELFDLDTPPSGEYTLELELTEGAAYRYNGCWIAEGDGQADDCPTFGVRLG